MDFQRDLLALAIYFIVLISVMIRFKQNKFSNFALWTGIFLVLYFCVIEIQKKTFYILIPLFFFLLFRYFYIKEKCRLRNGWLLNLALISFMGYVALVTLTASSLIGMGILGLLALLFLMTILFGIYAAVIFLIGNSFIVLRHESRKLPNLLTLILGLAIVALIILRTIGPRILPDWSVIERTKEIGVLKALGARKKDITRVFDAETCILGVASGTLGVLIAYLATFPINAILYNMTELENVAQLNPVHGVILIIVSTVLTMIGGHIPARMAAKKDAAIALRAE